MDDVVERMIRERALALWERDGRSGCATQHWLTAEREVNAGLAEAAGRMLSRFAADRRRSLPKLYLVRDDDRSMADPPLPIERDTSSYWDLPFLLGSAAAWMWLSVATWPLAVWEAGVSAEARP
jgi:hypothetical protein